MYRSLIYIWILFFPASIFCQGTTYSNYYFNQIKDELTDQWVSSITQDSEGFMWFATQDGLYKYDGKGFITYRYDPLNAESLPANWVRSIMQDIEGNFWLGTQGSGLIKFDPIEKSFDQVTSQEQDSFNLSIVYDVVATKSGAYWLNTDQGVFRKSDDNSGFSKLHSVAIRTQILELANKDEIVIIDQKLYRYHRENQNLELVLDNIAFGRALVFENSIIYRSEGKLYTYDIGKNPPVEIIGPNNDQFLFMSNLHQGKFIVFGVDQNYVYDVASNQFDAYESDMKYLRSLGINEIYLDQQNLLWVATSKGLFKESLLARVFQETIDLHARRIIADSSSLIVGGASGLFKIRKDDIENPVRISDFNQITAVCKTDYGIWAGDYYGNFFFVDHQNEITKFDLKVDERNPFKIYGIVEDGSRRIWVSTWEGIYMLNAQGEVLAKFRLKDSGEDVKVVQMDIDNSDNLWVATIGDGAFRVPNISKVTPSDNFDRRQYKNRKGNIRSLNANVVMEIHLNEEGELWFGGDFGINKYHPETDDFSAITHNDGLFDKKVMAIETDTQGRMWISSIGDGIFIYDTDNGRFFNLDKEDGLVSNACLFTSSSILGEDIYFGTDEGIQHIKTSFYQYPKVNMAPQVSNVTFLGNMEAAMPNPDTNDAVTINFDQNNFNINLEIADYRFPEKLNYYYKLNEEDRFWSKVEKNVIHLNSLNYGDYNLQVKAAYNASDDSPLENMAFTIKPPWYKSLLATVILFLLLSTLVFYFFQLRYRQKLDSKKLKVIEELDAFKSKLFANISHELRTPLTLISGPIENQLAKDNLKSEDRSELNLAKQNATRLLNLVNQMLDLSLVDSGAMQLNIEHGNLAVLLKQILDAFQYVARKNKLQIVSDISGLESAWYDPDCIEKVVTNLISNAIKYAPEGSEITVNATEQNENLSLSIVNASESFSEEHMGQLFQRFYQNDNSSEGIGVGLALVKELVTLSNGNIIANSISDEKIQFSVTLPISEGAFGAVVTELSETDFYETELAVEKAETIDNVLLIVEDNAEIREFVGTIFKDEYHILEAENGEIGVNLAKEHIPDLIISDVMMPIMDGIALCNTLKYDELTSHIPIILLTAKTGNKNEIEGLKTGADAYITKPFSVEKVKVRVRKLIENRRQLQKHYGQDFVINPGIAISSTEAAFLKRLQETLDAHITSTDFTSERFAELMLMSRTQLHRKLKASFDMNASGFIRSQRLKLAITLLRESDATNSEIAYNVGFNSPSYFSKCFKETYGCTPREYDFQE